MITDANRIIEKSPLISSLELLPQTDTILLVSCCNENGGLYFVRFKNSLFSYKAIIDGDCRGIARYGDCLVLASNTHGLILFDKDFQIISQYRHDSLMDYHGATVHQDFAYILETYRNAIGIYKLPELERIDEIILDHSESDTSHVNDLIIIDDYIYLSMFSNQKKWRDCPVDSGVIVKIDMKDFNKREILFEGLKHPHSIKPIDSDFVYCNSSNFEIKKNNDVIFKGNGFLRGLEKIENTYFFGQSETRNVIWMRKENTNISIDSGLHVFHENEKISRFFSLPSPEVYGILNYSDAFENVKKMFPEENGDQNENDVLIAGCLYIDKGNGIDDTESIRQEMIPGRNQISIDLSAYPEIKKIIFSPANVPCICSLNSVSLQKSSGITYLEADGHNARLTEKNLYYFNHDHPQITINNVDTPISGITIEFDLNIDKNEIEAKLTELIEQCRYKAETVTWKDIIRRHFRKR